MTQISKFNCVLTLTFLISLLLVITPVQATSVSEVDSFELTFNPILYFNDQRLNPFGIPAVRSAMNMVVNRQELIDLVNPNWLTTPLWTPLSKYGEEYTKLVSTFNQIEVDYAYSFTTAETIISDELINKGAYKNSGIWYYQGEPIKIIFIIRIEDDRQIIGDYIADQLENLGFTIERLYKSAAEAHLIWLLSDPADGDWHIYTGQWIFLYPHHEAENFQYFYTPHSSLALSSPLWAAYDPDPIFLNLSEDLALDAFPSESARHDALENALDWALKDSVRIWLMEFPIYRHYMPLIRR